MRTYLFGRCVQAYPSPEDDFAVHPLKVTQALIDPATIPDYENYDYRSEWANKQIEDLAEKRILSSWIRPSKSCLELGGGFGRLTSLFEQYFSEVVMLDFSRTNIQRASQKVKRTGMIRAELHNLPFKDEMFDYIFLIRVVHHLPDPLVVLTEIQRVAKQGATVVISAPNPILTKYRHLRSNTFVGQGECGHRIYVAPLEYYSSEQLKENARLGTGIFENFIGMRLHRFTFLHLADVVVSPIWYVKPNVFMKYTVTKN